MAWCIRRRARSRRGVCWRMAHEGYDFGVRAMGYCFHCADWATAHNEGLGRRSSTPWVVLSLYMYHNDCTFFIFIMNTSPRAMRLSWVLQMAAATSPRTELAGRSTARIPFQRGHGLMHVIPRDAFGSLFTHSLGCFLLLHTNSSRQLIAGAPEVARAPRDALAKRPTTRRASHQFTTLCRHRACRP
jgi:hypothetical protein